MCPSLLLWILLLWLCLYDIKTSPISNKLGPFPKFINSLDNSKRSPNPILCLLLYKDPSSCMQIVNRHSYGEDSAYDRLYKLNLRVLLGPQFNNLTFCTLCGI